MLPASDISHHLFVNTSPLLLLSARKSALFLVRKPRFIRATSVVGIASRAESALEAETPPMIATPLTRFVYWAPVVGVLQAVGQ